MVELNQETRSSISQDDFFGSTARPTEGDHRDAPRLQPEPSQEEKDKEEEDKINAVLEDAKLLADISVEMIDLLVVQGCKLISDEHDEDLFKVSDKRRERIKKPLAIIFERSKIKMNPWFLIAVMVVVAYAPVLAKAVELKMKKDKVKKMNQGIAPILKIEQKRGPGRPSNAEKELMKKAETALS
jgi:hypothetical protein